MAIGVVMPSLWCSFVLVEVPDITGIPAFTQDSTYGYYPVWYHLLYTTLSPFVPLNLICTYSRRIIVCSMIMCLANSSRGSHENDELAYRLRPSAGWAQRLLNTIRSCNILACLFLPTIAVPVCTYMTLEMHFQR